MPLVTRQANQGVFFKVADEPPDWQNSDIWIDTDNSDLSVNRAGTAVKIADGTLVQGDLYIATATDTMGRLAAGTADQHLIMNDEATLPNWETFAGVTTANQQDLIAADFSTTSNTYVDTGLQITIGNVSGGSAMLACTAETRNGTDGTAQHLAISDDDTVINEHIVTEAVNLINPSSWSASLDLDGSVIDIQIHGEGGDTIQLLRSAGVREPQLVSIEVS